MTEPTLADVVARLEELKAENKRILNRIANSAVAASAEFVARKLSTNRFSIKLTHEAGGRIIAEVVELPGVLAYGSTRSEAIAAVEALALRVLADRIEHGEIKPDRAIAFDLPLEIEEDEFEFLEIEDAEVGTGEKNSLTENTESTHSSQRSVQKEEIWERGDRAIAIASGGAVLGGLIGQIPGAVIGGIAGALFGFFVLSKKPAADLN